jgi:hypothetical protein
MTKDPCNIIGQGASVGVVATPVAPSYREVQPRRPATRDQRDLCCVCTYVSECMHRGTAESPKLFCEMFDVDVPALALREGGSDDEDNGSKAIGGLCSNCENRKTCTIRAGEGDVWHCEEYR